MARSRESIWLAHAGGLSGAGGVLLGISAALGAVTKGYSVWTSAPAIVAYVLFGLAVACFACAFYDVPISLPKRMRNTEPVLTAVHPQTARVGDRVTAYGSNLITKSVTPSLMVAVAGVDAAVLPRPAAAARGLSAAGAADEVTFLVPPPPGFATPAPGDRLQVYVITPSGLVAVLNNALAIVPDQPVAVGLSPALLTVASAAEYADIRVTIQGQYLATPGATTADTAAAQVSVRGPNTAATTTAAYVDDHQVSFTLPPDTPVPGAAPLALQVQLSRGATSTQSLTLSVQAAPAPELDTIYPNLIIADPGTSLGGQPITLAGANLVPPQAVTGSQPHVAQAGAEPLQAAVTAATGTVGKLADQPRAEDMATVSLDASLATPAAGDTAVGITLRRGTLSSASLTLTVRARHDPAMAVAAIAAPAGTPLAGHNVTLNSDVFSVNIPLAPAARHVADATPLVAHIDACGVPLDVANLPKVPDGGQPSRSRCRTARRPCPAHRETERPGPSRSPGAGTSSRSALLCCGTPDSR